MLCPDDNECNVGQRKKRKKNGTVLYDEKKGGCSERTKQSVGEKYAFEVNNKVKNG